MIRVRCAWENTTQGLPKKPLAELVRLTVDAAEVSPMLVSLCPAARWGAAFLDVIPPSSTCPTLARRASGDGTVRALATGAESDR